MTRGRTSLVVGGLVVAALVLATPAPEAKAWYGYAGPFYPPAAVPVCAPVPVCYPAPIVAPYPVYYPRPVYYGPVWGGPVWGGPVYGGPAWGPGWRGRGVGVNVGVNVNSSRGYIGGPWGRPGRWR